MKPRPDLKIVVSNEPAPAAVTFPSRPITSACLSSTVEEDRQPLAVQDSTVRLTLPSRRLTTIRVW